MNPPAVQPVSENPEKPLEKHKRRWLWQGQIGPAFWTITGILSLVVNVILIIALIILGQQLFDLKKIMSEQLISGLYNNFVKMDQAHIQTTIKINTTIPVKFDLPVKTNTTVTLTQDTTIKGTRVSLSTGGLTILSAPTNITLPAGTILPIALDISVPVSTTVPVILTVPVDIPLDQTQLHEPFTGLQEVLQPYRSLLSGLPNSWNDLLCKKDETGQCQQP